MLITTAQAVGNLAAPSRPRPRTAAARKDDAAEEVSPDQRVARVRAADAMRQTEADTSRQAEEDNHLPPGSLYDISA